MKAAVLRQPGGPGCLELTEWPDPQPAAGEVLVRVRTVCVNRMDLDVFNNRGIGRGVSLPVIPGIDPAGDVVALGEGVGQPAVGQRVVVKTNIACFACRFCLRGDEDACERNRNIGVHRPGGFAEYVAVPASNVFPIPDHLPYEQASAFSHSFPVALHQVRSVGRIRPDDQVLVLAAGGGLGLAVLQIAKLAGARVIAGAGSEEKLKVARELGADDTINYSEEPEFAGSVRELTGGRGVSLAIENTGAPSLWRQLLQCLDRCGRVVLSGAHAGAPIQLDLHALYRQRVSLLFTAGATYAEYREALELVGQGRLRPIVHTVMPLDQIHAAFAAMEDRANTGKIALRVA